MLRALSGLFACVLLSGAPAGPDPHRDPSLLRPGLFLYAAPGLPETRFAETVVLLIDHGPKGSMGLVVNRPTEIPLHRALDGVEVLFVGPFDLSGSMGLLGQVTHPDVQAAIDDRSRLGVFDDMNKLMQMKTAMAMERVMSSRVAPDPAQFCASTHHLNGWDGIFTRLMYSRAAPVAL